MNARLDALTELLFPTKCTFCHKLTGSPRKTLCDECAKKLPFVPEGARGQHFPHIAECVSPLYYEGSVRASLHRYKFSGCSFYAELYGEFIVEAVRNNKLEFELISWVPVSRKRLRKRGYDQAKLLAERLSELSGVPCVQLVKKIRDNKAQSLTDSADERKKNVNGVYRIADAEAAKGKRVLLVDDIVTTGATLSECAACIRSAGCEKVYAATLARSR